MGAPREARRMTNQTHHTGGHMIDREILRRVAINTLAVAVADLRLQPHRWCCPGRTTRLERELAPLAPRRILPYVKEQAVDNTAPPISAIVEMITDDVYTFGPEDAEHIRVGGVLGYESAASLEHLIETIREPDGWVEFGGATVRRGENEWDEDGPAHYSRTTIFARHVASMVVVYDEPARMDWPGWT